MTNISINTAVRDKKSLFISKTIKIGEKGISTPFKLFDFNDMPSLKKIQELNKEQTDQIDFIEKSLMIKADKFLKEIENPNANFLNDSYDAIKNIESFKNKMIINTLTLKFNPFYLKDFKGWMGIFLDLYYPKSDFLMIPNLKVRRYDKITEKPMENTTVDQYEKYVDFAFQTLNYKNSKPIFIPIPLEYGPRQFMDIVKTHIDAGFHNFWIDCLGANVFKYAPHLRSFNRFIENEGLDKKIILYVTNMRRELNPDRKNIECPASDILNSPLGVDLIGVNREAQKALGDFTPKPIPEDESVRHKARFINRENYNYISYDKFPQRDAFFKKYNIDVKQLYDKPKFYTNLANTFELNDEFNYEKYLLANEEPILDHLKKKPSIPPMIMKAITKIIEKPNPNVNLNKFLS